MKLFFVKGMYAQAINYRIDSFNRLIFLTQRKETSKPNKVNPWKWKHLV